MAKYNLLDISLKQSFANSGLIQRVPYQLPAKEDDLNWLEGFTDAFQRPVLPQADAGNANGRYIKMGQLNQVLQNLSQAILNVKQGLNNVAGVIDDDVSIRVENAIKESEKAINNRVVSWLQTINNQNCAGLKNFQDINIDNFKTKANAVANLEWCNGMPIQTLEIKKTISSTDSSYTYTGKNGFFIFSPYEYVGGKGLYQIYLNGVLYNQADNYGEDKYSGAYAGYNLYAFGGNKDVFRFFYYNVGGLNVFDHYGS